MTKTPNIRRVALLIAAGLVASLPARPGLAQEAGFEAYNFSAVNVPCAPHAVGSPDFTCAATSSQIPMGKRLVIQHVAARINGNPGGTSYNLVVGSTDAMGVKSPAAFISKAPSADGVFGHSQQILGYADGAPIGASMSGATVFAHIETDTNLTNFTATFSVAGYLLDCNPTTLCPPIVTQ
jgi:hypothetical protein